MCRHIYREPTKVDSGEGLKSKDLGEVPTPLPCSAWITGLHHCSSFAPIRSTIQSPHREKPVASAWGEIHQAQGPEAEWSHLYLSLCVWLAITTEKSCGPWRPLASEALRMHQKRGLWGAMTRLKHHHSGQRWHTCDPPQGVETTNLWPTTGGWDGGVWPWRPTLTSKSDCISNPIKPNNKD